MDFGKNETERIMSSGYRPGAACSCSSAIRLSPYAITLEKFGI